MMRKLKKEDRLINKWWFEKQQDSTNDYLNIEKEKYLNGLGLSSRMLQICTTMERNTEKEALIKSRNLEK